MKYEPPKNSSTAFKTLNITLADYFNTLALQQDDELVTEYIKTVLFHLQTHIDANFVKYKGLVRNLADIVTVKFLNNSDIQLLVEGIIILTCNNYSAFKQSRTNNETSGNANINPVMEAPEPNKFPKCLSLSDYFRAINPSSCQHANHPTTIYKTIVKNYIIQQLTKVYDLSKVLDTHILDRIVVEYNDVNTIRLSLDSLVIGVINKYFQFVKTQELLPKKLNIVETSSTTLTQKKLMEGLLAGNVFVNNSKQYLFLKDDELAILTGNSFNKHHNPVRQLKASSWTLCTPEEEKEVKEILKAHDIKSQLINEVTELMEKYNLASIEKNSLGFRATYKED